MSTSKIATTTDSGNSSERNNKNNNKRLTFWFFVDEFIFIGCLNLASLQAIMSSARDRGSGIWDHRCLA